MFMKTQQLSEELKNPQWPWQKPIPLKISDLSKPLHRLGQLGKKNGEMKVLPGMFMKISRM
jgi:hypothetical protein